jgi:hypothetical protein
MSHVNLIGKSIVSFRLSKSSTRFAASEFSSKKPNDREASVRYRSDVSDFEMSDMLVTLMMTQSVSYFITYHEVDMVGWWRSADELQDT